MIPTLPTPTTDHITTPPPMEDWGSLLENIFQKDDASPSCEEQSLRLRKEIHDNRNVISSHPKKMQRLENKMHNLELKPNSTENEEDIFLGKQISMSKYLQECIKEMNEMKINIHTLMKDKDTLFAKHRDMKVDISCIEDAVQDNNMEATRILSDHKTSIAQIK